jgi:hypothetical protein
MLKIYWPYRFHNFKFQLGLNYSSITAWPVTQMCHLSTENACLHNPPKTPKKPKRHFKAGNSMIFALSSKCASVESRRVFNRNNHNWLCSAHFYAIWSLAFPYFIALWARDNKNMLWKNNFNVRNSASSNKIVGDDRPCCATTSKMLRVFLERNDFVD